MDLRNCRIINVNVIIVGWCFKMANYRRMNKIYEEEEKAGFMKKTKEEANSWADHLVIEGQRQAEDMAMVLGENE